MKPLAIGICTDLWDPSRVTSRGRNCAPAAATAVTPTSPPSPAATSPLHHWCVRRMAVFSSPQSLCHRPVENGRRRQTQHHLSASSQTCADHFRQTSYHSIVPSYVRGDVRVPRSHLDAV